MPQSLNLFELLDLRPVTSSNRVLSFQYANNLHMRGILSIGIWYIWTALPLAAPALFLPRPRPCRNLAASPIASLGLWADSQIAGHARIAQFARRHGAIPAIQLAHAGRKSGMQRPWFGNGPLDQADFARGDMPWPAVGPSAVAIKAGWPLPNVLSEADIDTLIVDFAGPQNGRRRRNIRSPRCMVHMAICCIVFSRHYPFIGLTAMVAALPDGCG